MNLNFSVSLLILFLLLFVNHPMFSFFLGGLFAVFGVGLQAIGFSAHILVHPTMLALLICLSCLSL